MDMNLTSGTLLTKARVFDILTSEFLELRFLEFSVKKVEADAPLVENCSSKDDVPRAVYLMKTVSNLLRYATRNTWICLQRSVPNTTADSGSGELERIISSIKLTYRNTR